MDKEVKMILYIFLFFIIGFPIFLIWLYTVGISSIFKHAEKIIEDGYKGKRLPLYKYDELITILENHGERGKRLANELKLIRDGKITPEKQLEKELEETDD